MVLIGNAGPNTPEEVREKRSKNNGGERYWSRTRFSQMTTADIQLKALQEKGVKIHCFYLADRPRAEFKRIADLTGGDCQEFDIHLVAQQVLDGIGSALCGLRKEYTTMFCGDYLQ